VTRREIYIEQGFDYKDICLVPQKCVVESRKDCDVSVQFGPRKFILPTVPANMPAVVDQDFCTMLAKRDMYYVMHRFGTNVYEFMRYMEHNRLYTSISIGIKQQDKDLMDGLWRSELSPDYVTIDVANCWSDRCKDVAKIVKYYHPDTFLTVGNVATPEAVVDIESWGTVDAIKVGIAGGAACTTKNKTGFRVPMVNSLLNCGDVATLPIIACGGVGGPGDVAKALACGATMVMAGKYWAQCNESAGQGVDKFGKSCAALGYDCDGFEIPMAKSSYSHKLYYGNASNNNKDERRNIEGTSVVVEVRGSLDDLIGEMIDSLQSAVSYAGGTDLKALYGVEMIIGV